MRWTRRNRRRLVDGVVLVASQSAVVVFVHVLLILTYDARHFYLSEARRILPPYFRAEIWFDGVTSSELWAIALALAVLGSAACLAIRRHWGAILVIEILVPTVFCAWLAWRMIADLKGGGFMYQQLFPW